MGGVDWYRGRVPPGKNEINGKGEIEKSGGKVARESLIIKNPVKNPAAAERRPTTRSAPRVKLVRRGSRLRERKEERETSAINPASPNFLLNTVRSETD